MDVFEVGNRQSLLAADALELDGMRVGLGKQRSAWPHQGKENYQGFRQKQTTPEAR
jgi:hypothetical protein